MNDLILSLNKKMLPIVAIAGRPNVGKSTLFNRLIKKRKAITASTPGVTRDPVEAEYILNGRKILLVDTGGYKIEKEALDSLVVGRSLSVIKEADVLILLMDINEITPEDDFFIEELRPYSEKIILAVNKVDNIKREYNLWNYYSFGFSSVIGISAEHGLNCGELEDEVAKRIESIEIKEIDVDKKPDINLAILGKPNTGKSTLTNHLTGSMNSIVSEIPGTTRDVIEGGFEYNDNFFRILDTAGIRRKNKVEQDVEYYSVNRAIKSISESDIVFIVIDCLESVTEQEKKIASLVIKKGKGIIFVLNKWDKLRNIQNQNQAIIDRIRFVFPVLHFVPIIPISALKGTGVKELLDMALIEWKQLNMRIDTSELNKKLKDWVEQYSPPRSSRTFYKTRYITQTGVTPVVFVLFVNRIKGFPRGYKRYLSNKIREEFNFKYVPFKIELRER